LPNLPELNDQPFGTLSSYPQYVLSSQF